MKSFCGENKKDGNMSAESKTKNVAVGLGLLVVFTCCPLKAYAQSSSSEPIFKKGRNYISPDRDGHNGGVWKKAKSVEALDSKATRAGTYDENLNFIHK